MKDSGIFISLKRVRMSLHICLWVSDSGLVPEGQYDWLLLSAGFALSAGIEKSKLSLWLGSHMRILHFVPYVLLPLVVAVIINIITEFTANAATATLFLPLLADVALSLNLHPLLLMIPATFASNFSFMLPVATPPNAIARATGYIHTTDLMIPGLLLKLFGTFLLTVLTPTLGEMLGTTTYPLSLSFLHNMCSQGFPSFLLSCWVFVYQLKSLFQVLTFDPSCFSCFWLLPRYMGVWTWPTNHPLTFSDHEMTSWEEIVDQMQIPAWDNDQSILYKMDSQLPSLDLHKPCPATTHFSTHHLWRTPKLLCSLTLMSASVIQLALILSAPFSLLILEVILYASIFPPLLSLKGDWLLDCSRGYKIHLSEKCFLHGRDTPPESFWVRVWNELRV